MTRVRRKTKHVTVNIALNFDVIIYGELIYQFLEIIIYTVKTFTNA